jgi:transcriptional regulator with XRE-family HTH domain
MKDGIYLKEMGKKIKAAREAKGIYLRDLAKLCNIHYGAICEIENGKRNSHILTLKNLADKLGVDVKQFL